MAHLLLAISYVSFISLGLPDSLLGAGWPVMYQAFDVPLSYMGIVSILTSGTTIVSSLLADRLTRKFGTNTVTVVSVFVSAAALLGFSVANQFWMLLVFAIPYGLSAGAIDAALNNYVAQHYSSKLMSWLHCFWGVGATLGPYIMGWAIGANHGWRTGYRTVSLIQFTLTAILFLTLFLWKKRKSNKGNEEIYEAPIGLKDSVKIPGVKAILLAFFCYCAFESLSGLWASSYLVRHKGVLPETAAFFASMFYMGITAGRFVSGFVCNRIGDKNMIRIGSAIMGVGIILIALPIKAVSLALIGLVVSGLGAAPVYPSIIHSTPENFGAENSHAIVGIQMASAYCGSTFMPPLFGLVAQHIHIGLYPLFMTLFLFVLFTMTERVNKTARREIPGSN